MFRVYCLGLGMEYHTCGRGGDDGEPCTIHWACFSVKNGSRQQWGEMAASGGDSRGRWRLKRSLLTMGGGGGGGGI